MLDTTIWLPDGKGGAAATKTAGITREQVEMLIARTTAPGGYPDWIEAAATLQAWMRLRGIEPKLRWLTKAEADEVIAALKDGQAGTAPAQSEGAGATPGAKVLDPTPSQAGPTPRERLDLVLRTPEVAPHEVRAVRAICALYKVQSLVQLTEAQALSAATDLSALAKDPETMGIVLDRMAVTA